MDCGECTLCCKLLDIPEVESPHNVWCRHCDEDGCKMYEDRPDGCREFECAWLQMERAGIEMRPDRCGVVFEKLSDDVMGGVTDGYMTYLVRGQVDAFNREGLSVVIFDHSTRRKACFLAEGHTIEFVEAEIHGGAKLY